MRVSVYEGECEVKVIVRMSLGLRRRKESSQETLHA